MESNLSPARAARRASSVWTVAATVCLLGSVVMAFLAVAHQVRESRPQGEGELFLQEATRARAILGEALDGGETLDEAVRRVRNALAIEAVGVAEAEGGYLASTSPNWVGREIDPPFLLDLLQQGRFGAITAPLSAPVLIDGVVEWEPGEALYQVIHPLEGGGALVLSYDVSSLLSRRAAQAGIRTLTLILAGAGVLLLVAGILLLVARAGARRRIAQAVREAELMETRSRELERHNRELEEARDQAERALALAEETNRIRSEFVLMINHELRTPLTSVVTGAELLEEGELDAPDRRQVLSDMVRDGRRLQELISQMLTVARIENRGLGYTLRDIRLEEVLEQVERLVGDRVGCDGETIRCALDPAGVVLRTDPEPLTQLILSLADNARTHGARRVCLEVVGELPFTPLVTVGDPPERAVFFLVQDDGPGIDVEFLPRAFEKFEKLGRSSGTGLGLYLARLMAEAIEGVIAVQTGSEGTTMAVGVPAVRVVAPEAVRT